MKAAVLILGLLLCSAVTAGAEPWMKKENPETLHFHLVANPVCLVSEVEAREIISGVLVRSRLRPGDLVRSTEELGFVVDVDCLKPTGEFAPFNVGIMFVRKLFGRALLEAEPRYGSFGVANSESIKNAIRQGVEDLVAHYLQANFDLSPE